MVKVLIIEDDIVNAKMLEQFLSPGLEVVLAHTAKGAIEAGILHLPDLIISDWGIRDEMDGVAICGRIAEHHKASIIFVSGSPIEQLREVSQALAPLHLLTKPVDVENLSSLINEWKMSRK